MAAPSIGSQRQFEPLKTHTPDNGKNFMTNFPDTFKDFFSRITESEDNDEVIVAMLEDKLIPRESRSASGSGNATSMLGDTDGFKNYKRLQMRRGAIPRRSFHRRSSEYHSRPVSPSPLQKLEPATEESAKMPVSPAIGRRRSSSIAVTRQPPDLHRFLMAEQQRPWGHISPTPSTSPRPLSPRGNRQSQPLENFGYRSRTSSMPAVPRHRPMLGQLRRSGDEASEGVEYYRVRSFSITQNGVFNLGDSFKSRRSRSINSVSSTGSSEASNTNRERLPSTASQCSTGMEDNEELSPPRFKVAMLGASGVGKTALTCQFTTSEYICAYDTSLDEEFGQKTVSVMLDGQEAELEIVDHPAAEMSVESYCATYNPDVFVVVYSVVERKSFKVAEDILAFLCKSDYVATRGVILVGNKADLERKREVPMSVGRKLANTCGCKFIETSSGLDHNVDELLVGILAQVKLNPRRDREKFNRKSKKKQKIKMGSGRRILRHLLNITRKSRSCENLFVI